MTCRFVVYRWDVSNRGAQTEAARLANALLTSGEVWERHQVTGLDVLWIRGKSPAWRTHILPQGGAVIGTLFRRTPVRTTAERVTAFTEAEEVAIQKTHGGSLISDFWGRYVAAIHAPDTGRAWFIRDPSGAVGAFYGSIGHVDVLFSHPTEISQLGLDTTIDWDYIQRRLIYNRLQNSGTGLLGVRQLNAGERVNIVGAHRTVSLGWDPRRFASDNVIEDAVQAATELRETTQHCISAWSSCFNQIVHRLSGGLDSSIVAAFLATTYDSEHMVNLNLVTPTAEGDELSYARSLSDHISRPLVTMRRNPQNVCLKRALPLAKSVTPPLWLAEIEIEEFENSLANELGADAFFGGRGGDNVFYTGRTSLVAADYIWNRGLTARAPAIFRAVAALARTSIWEVAFTAMRFGFRSAGRRPHPIESMLAEQPSLTEVGSETQKLQGFLHPWAVSDGTIAPAKFEQLQYLVDCQNYCSYNERFDNIYPLVSQPLVELCLRIPTYVLCIDGVDRGLARRAFEGAVPRKILQRTSKGGTTEYLVQVVLGNLPFLRTFISDGVLSSVGLIKADRFLALATEETVVRDGACAAQIIEYFGIEAWARNWSSRQQKAAA